MQASKIPVPLQNDTSYNYWQKPSRASHGQVFRNSSAQLLPEEEVRRRVLEKQHMQKIAHDKNVKQRNFLVEELWKWFQMDCRESV